MTNQTTSSWTDDLKSEVKTLWADHSATEIVMVFNERGYTFTRNAVIGVLHRAGLTAEHKSEVHPSSNRKGGGQTDKRTPKIGTATIQLRCVEIVPLNLTLMERADDQCHYIPCDDHLYCGHPVMPGSNMCVPHHHLCWVPPISATPKARIYRGTDFSRGAA